MFNILSIDAHCRLHKVVMDPKRGSLASPSPQQKEILLCRILQKEKIKKVRSRILTNNHIIDTSVLYWVSCPQFLYFIFRFPPGNPLSPSHFPAVHLI